MFVCKDCGEKYEIKPNYCNCGNDEFIEDNSVIKNIKQEKQSENIAPIISDSSKNWLRNNMPSIIIFIVCLTISVGIFFIKDNVQEKNEPIAEKEKITKPVNWALFEDDSKPASVQPFAITESKIEKPVNKSEIAAQLKQVNTSQKKSNLSKIKAENNTQKIIEQKKIQEKAKAEAKAKENAKIKAEALAKAKSEELKKQQARKELVNYKNILSATFYNKIDFTNIIGQGSCEITFKIDQNGNLKNKAFSKQSSNITLNDAVFYAVKNTSRVLAPPSVYKGENLILKVSYNNGNYTLTVE